jgi:hypothetical protein
MDDSRHPIPRRDFLKASTSVALAAMTAPTAFAQTAPSSSPSKSQRTIGIQVGSISFLDEGVDQVLDTLQQRGNVNTIFLATFTYGRGIAGRQVPGQPLPDHGAQEYDEKTFHGGNYATPHARFYEKTALKQTKAPDHGENVDILEMVLPKAKQRGIKVYCWYEDVFRSDVPGIEPLRELDLEGRRANTLCPLHPDYRSFLTGLTEDYCKSYDIDGVMWGSERQGPLNNMIGAKHGGGRGEVDPTRATCFCELHQKAAKDRGIDVARAKQGYGKLAEFIQRAVAGDRPTDGYFVTFWRLLLDYPEILAWEKLWTDSKHAIYGDIYRTAKAAKPNVQVGFHIWHVNSFSPFFRAEQEYDRFAKVADYLKIVLYNNCGGPRYARAVENVGNTIFRDVPKDELLAFHNHLLNYGDEKGINDLPKSGLSSDYVARETKRALDGVQGKCKIYPGIDIDIPTDADQKKTTPDDVYAATSAALRAGANGIIFSRKYSEMRLANLSAGGRAVNDAR